ncbi:hypothetical protein LA080_000533 [Diaporthe eres]|nr:hypothetical protein LA080_000533 [Diaporthe eres]
MCPLSQQLEKADQERFELQKQLKALESGSALAAQKAAHEQIIKNLQRENAMISTAWYDLTSRLQSNHVVLQRKDQPKSWLNKQRQMVNGKEDPFSCTCHAPKVAASRPVGNPGGRAPGAPHGLARGRRLGLALGIGVDGAG